MAFDENGTRAALRAALLDAIKQLHSLADIFDALITRLWLVNGIAHSPLGRSVPYRSQSPDGAKFTGDCGPACLAMLIEWATGEWLSIDSLAIECGMSPTKNYTTAADLIAVAEKHGVNLVRINSLDPVRIPIICLVHYGDMPRMDIKYLAGHWILITRVESDKVFYHDSDWYGIRMSEGRNREIDRITLDKAITNSAQHGGPIFLSVRGM